MSKCKTIGWVLSLLLAAFFVFVSAQGKLTGYEEGVEKFEQVGFTNEVMFRIGIVEVACVILFLIPQTSFVGAILLTGYLGGAVVTHVRIGDSFVMPIVIGVVVWIALGLRNRAIFSLAMGQSIPKSTDESPEN